MKKFLMLILILSVMCVNGFAQDVVGDDILKTLADYQILEGDPNGDLRLGDKVTNAEMAKIIVCSSGVEKSKNIENIIDDIDDLHWAKDYINIAYQNRWIDFEDKNFNVDTTITNSEVIKSIINLLGYSPMAEQRGGYPQGYVIIANNLGITEGLNLNMEDKATRSDVAIMINKALDIPLMQQSKNGEAVEYKIFDGKNDGTPLHTLKIMLDRK